MSSCFHVISTIPCAWLLDDLLEWRLPQACLNCLHGDEIVSHLPHLFGNGYVLYKQFRVPTICGLVSLLRIRIFLSAM